MTTLMESAPKYLAKKRCKTKRALESGCLALRGFHIH